MKTLFTCLSCVFFLSLHSQLGSWLQKTPLNASKRTYGISFSINNKGYAGFGSTNFLAKKNDLWEYDPIINIWTQKANMPAIGRVGAAAFVINGKAYIVGGRDSIDTFLNDVWQYDPVLNTWTQLPNFPGAGRAFAAVFCINNKAYLCTGRISNSPSINVNEVWEFTTTGNSWVQKSNFTGGVRAIASGFAIGNFGYVAFGFENTTSFSDIWQYDPSIDTWTQKPNTNIDPRTAANAIVINSEAYLLGGYLATGQNFLKYNPASNTWTQVPQFSGSDRYGAFAFSLYNKGYLGMGMSPSGSNYEYTDLWEYTPTITGFNEQTLAKNNLFIYPNPATENIEIIFQSPQASNLNYKILNSLGQVVKSESITGYSQTLDISLLAGGLYMLQVTKGSEIMMRDKFVKH